MENKQEKIERFMGFSKEKLIDSLLDELEKNVEFRFHFGSIFRITMMMDAHSTKPYLDPINDKAGLIGVCAAYDYLDKDIPLFNTMKAWDMGHDWIRRTLAKMALGYFHGIDNRKKYVMEGK